MPIRLIATKKYLVSPEGYDKIYREIVLYYSDEPEVGSNKHWFVSNLSSPCSRKWLNDDEVRALRASIIVDQIIKEENKSKIL